MTLHRITVFLVLINVLYSCSDNPKGISNSNISVSILPQKYLIDRLSDSSLSTNVIVPPGSSPEMFEPTPMLMKNIANSSLLFVIGPLEFEKVLVNRIRELNPKLKIVNHSDGLELLEDECGHAHHDHSHALDPHIWSSPKIFAKMAETVCKELTNLYPDKADLFKRNLELLKLDISKIDSGFVSISQSKRNKKFIVYHPAYGYLSHDYGFMQLSLEESGKNPSAEKMKDLIDTAKLNKISKVFVQAQFDEHFIEALAKEINAEIVQVDPLAYDWIRNNQLLIEHFK